MDQLSGEDVEYTSVGRTAQFLAGLAGLVAVPVVAWSEYTLQTTGTNVKHHAAARLVHLCI